MLFSLALMTLTDSGPLKATVAILPDAPPVQSSGAAALTIVVIAGEDAVNIIQQKTAVAPIVEVRDRNDQPVAGVAVTFVIRRGRASLAGTNRQVATTDASGRAAITGFTPTGSGALQILASAAFQGQTAAVTISQTNVATAAQAAALTAGAGGSAAAGWGLSGTAIAGIATGVGLGAAGGAWALSRPARASAVPVAPVTYRGPYSARFDLVTTTSFPDRTASCVQGRTFEGVLTITITQQLDGRVSGTGATTSTETVVQAGATCSNQSVGQSRSDVWSLEVTGSAENITFNGSLAFSNSLFSGGTVSGARALTLSGRPEGDNLVGSVTFREAGEGVTEAPPPSPVVVNGTATFPVLLRR